MNLIAPTKHGYRGSLSLPPTAFSVSVAIPHIGTIESLKACIALLQHQSLVPYIMVIDTGTPEEMHPELESLRTSNVEIHYIRAHGYSHASEPVTAALDLAQTLCRSRHLFHTHSDCFLMNRHLLGHLVTRCTAQNPVVGYRMSPRNWATNEWEWMVSHTATMLYMPSIHRIGATWSYQRIHALGYDSTKFAGWPDTETAFNRALQEGGIVPEFIGQDLNEERLKDENIDHVRSFAGSRLYHAGYHAKASVWMDAALKEAWERVAEWSRIEIALRTERNYCPTVNIPAA